MFTVVEHVIPCQFVREYPRATANGQNTGLSLAIKQYTPTKIPDASFPRITIIGAHGNGFPKVSSNFPHLYTRPQLMRQTGTL